MKEWNEWSEWNKWNEWMNEWMNEMNEVNEMTEMTEMNDPAFLIWKNLLIPPFDLRQSTWSPQFSGAPPSW